jgi:cytochrome c553
MKFVTAKIRFAAVAAVMAVGSYSAAVQAEALGNAAAGEAKAGLCGGCHGFDGNSEDATYPRLAGQYAGYIVKQIKDFQKGHRANNDTMAGMAATVASDEDAKDIGAYFAQQKIKGALTKPTKETVATGEKLFREGNVKTGVYACVNCHGESGKGKSASVSTFPVIGGQHRDYLVKQLKEFREGVRANDPAGMMSAIAKNLSDKEIEAVAEYLSSQL